MSSKAHTPNSRLMAKFKKKGRAAKSKYRKELSQRILQSREDREANLAAYASRETDNHTLYNNSNTISTHDIRESNFSVSSGAHMMLHDEVTVSNAVGGIYLNTQNLNDGLQIKLRDALRRERDTIGKFRVSESRRRDVLKGVHELLEHLEERVTHLKNEGYPEHNVYLEFAVGMTEHCLAVIEGNQ